ncbi:PstS family phosphate ABC transporter substrate-binding protein [Paracoccus aerodenitrificans]|uniref:PstS family phosphate ABC transporter substrate-binding protein n=1 Tax=Paracoccus aerodenitrificans TaxID=3017781 RepID=UPI0022F07CA2|nr:substrate-binding domain-containing protein [Paracoccus aerodenitrificans]WBU63798.1 substrate-binding domain-containing protein [Paracoccus aerodenitrificans]
MSKIQVIVSATAIIAASATVAAAQEQVQVAGSSTVLPYATIVAEAFAENTDFPAPVVEGGGSSAGLKQFCEGVGENTIDVANASRQIREAEIETCAANGVANIIEVQFGYDGIVFASDINGPDFVLTPADVFGALAAEVVVDGEVTANPNTNWSDVNPELPEQAIMAFIPGTKHGTREVFEEKVMLAGCEETGALEAFVEANGGDEDAAEGACMAVRTDGASVDIDGDYTETLARIASNPQGVGVFGLSFYENNTDTLKVATMSGVSPSVETVASGEYPVSRPLFFYVKKDHIGVVPGLKEYAEFFVSDAMAGPGGPLSEYGLVPDPELATVQETVANETTIQ